MRINKWMMCVALGACLTACGGKGSDTGKLTVTVSIPPQRWMVEQIAGDRVEVNTLMESNANPETFEPGVAQMGALQRSSAYFPVGLLPFEDDLAKRTGVKTVDTSKGVTLLYGTHDRCLGHGEGHHDHAGIADPHIWSSIPNARVMLANILHGLQEIDPDSRDFYQARFDSIDHALDSINQLAASKIKAESFLIWHPSLSYLARDYNLRQIAIGSETKETSPRQLQATIDQARSLSAPVLFYQKDIDPRQAQAINTEINASLVEINPMNPDWLGEITRVVNALENE
ncbi:MAG: zinc ABC transporter substrate-binding protein [Bacteroidales bacterium]|nr:zinc ABC transporter substrate-binding protein [Bacteroidales bacterium]